MEKIKLQNEIKQLLSVKKVTATNDDDDRKNDNDDDDVEEINKRRAILIKEYKRKNKECKKFNEFIQELRNTIANLKTLVREIILGQVRMQEIRHIFWIYIFERNMQKEWKN